MTEPPPTADAGGSCSAWHIYNAYMAEQERQKAAEDSAKAKSVAARQRSSATVAEDEDGEDVLKQVGAEHSTQMVAFRKLVIFIPAIRAYMKQWPWREILVPQISVKMLVPGAEMQNVGLNEVGFEQVQEEARNKLAAKTVVRRVERMLYQNLHRDIIMDFKVGHFLFLTFLQVNASLTQKANPFMHLKHVESSIKCTLLRPTRR
jgi:hypothetical protein